MTTVTLGIASVEQSRERLAAAFRGEPQGHHIAFASVELLWKVMTAKRWELLQVMAGQGAMSLREVARRVERGVNAVHGDVHALLEAGVLDRADDGRVEFLYAAVHVDFTLRKAA